MAVFVGRISPNTTTADLESAFGAIGTLTRCDIKVGFAFVTYADEANVALAIERLNDTVIAGSRVRVEYGSRRGANAAAAAAAVPAPALAAAEAEPEAPPATAAAAAPEMKRRVVLSAGGGDSESESISLARSSSLVVHEVCGSGDTRQTYTYQSDEFVSAISRTDGESASDRKPNTAPWRLALMPLYARLYAAFCSIFLPIGYPASVTADYAQFQIWDTAQALCSYLRGLLCTQAILTGVGVGSATATVASATVQWIVRDGTGMLGSVLFAWLQSSSFGYEPKRWRMFADIVNDLGLTVEMVSPYYPQYFLPLICVGSLCRALCGVSAGASRAALMNHFARANNVADLTAKEGIQETAVTLIGLVAGLALTWYLDGARASTWTLFIGLTLFHVYANYRGLSGLILTTLNRQRLTIVIRHFLKTNEILTPEAVATRERIFWFGASTVGARYRTAPVVRLGVPLHAVLTTHAQLVTAFDEYRNQRYVIAYVPRGGAATTTPTGPRGSDATGSGGAGGYGNSLCALWHASSTARDVLHACVQLEIVLAAVNGAINPTRAHVTGLIERALPESIATAAGCFNQFYSGLQHSGWDVNSLAVDTGDWRSEWARPASADEPKA